MSNLSKGSTVGGFGIITDLDSNEHVHSVDDIDGLGSAATAETGPGSGFDADTLNGLHYSDIENNLVNISGDTITSNVSLSSPIDETNDLSAISRGYTNQYISNNVMVGSNAIPFVSVSPSSILTYEPTNTSMVMSSGDILIGGNYYSFTTISKVFTPIPSHTHFVYMSLSNDTIELEVYDEPIAHDFTKIMVGRVEFNGSGDFQDIYQRQTMTNIANYGISHTAIRDSMIISNHNSEIDPEWFEVGFSDIVDTVTIKGDTVVSSESTTPYTITDYDQFSTYTVSSTSGSIGYQGDTITFNAPSVSSPVTARLSVTRNTTTFTFDIEVLP